MTDLEKYVLKPDINPLDVDEQDKPRPFTREEIEDILDALSDILCPTRELKDLALSQIKQSLRFQLIDIELMPSKIPILKDIIKEKYKAAWITPGHPVGSTIVDAFIQTFMQAALSFFHKSGTSDSGGFDVVRELMYLSASRKNEQVFVHFKESYSLAQIFSLRSLFVEKFIGQLINETEIDYASAFDTKWWHPMLLEHYDMKYDPNRIIMRIYFNVTDMVKYDVSMHDIEYILNTSEPNTVRILYGPIAEGIMDIYPLSNVAKEGIGIDPSIYYRKFFVEKFRVVLETTLISGIRGIKSLVPNYTNVVTAILSNHKLSPNHLYYLETNYDKRYNYWYIAKNMNVILFEGISDRDISDLLNYIGIFVQENKYQYMVVALPAYLGEISPYQLITEFESIISTINTKVKNKSSFNDLENYLLEVMNISLKESSEHIYSSLETYLERYKILFTKYYAIALSSNLKSILNMSMVDRYKTYSNNFFIMTKMFGIEMARTYHMYDIAQVIRSSGKTIDPRHIELFTNTCFFRGYPSGVNKKGIPEYSSGFASQMMTSHVKKNIINSSLFNVYGESTKNSGPSVLTGVAPATGSSYPGFWSNFDEKIDPKDIKDDVDISFDEIDSFENIVKIDQPIGESVYVNNYAETLDPNFSVTVNQVKLNKQRMNLQIERERERRLGKATPTKTKTNIMPEIDKKEVGKRLVKMIKDANPSIVTSITITTLSIIPLNISLPETLQDKLDQEKVPITQGVFADIFSLDEIPFLRLTSHPVPIPESKFLDELFQV